MNRYIDIEWQGWYVVCAGLFLISGLWSPLSVAAAINISGTVIASASCTINDNKDIDVDFGNAVDAELIKGDKYLQRMNFSHTCKNLTSSYQVAKIYGPEAGVGFDAGTLKTTDSNLGIKIKVGGYKYSPGEEIKFYYPQSFPVIELVLVASRNGLPAPGAFRSTGNSIVVTLF